MRPRGRLLVAFALFLSFPVRALSAEPEVSGKDLPRVPPTEPDKALSTFQIRKGFRLELVAAEPLVVDPIAMSFDEDGRLFVVEMRDYSERRPERLGRIRRLEDTDGDGRFDKSTVYVDDLPWPTAVLCYGGGVFVGATPDVLFCKDTNGDGLAEVRELVFTGFASDYAPYRTNRLNVQAMLNSFNWGLDNRIHGSASLSGGKVTRVDSLFVSEWLRNASNSSPSPGREGVKPRGGNAPLRGRGEGKPQSSRSGSSDSPIDLRGKDFSFDPRTLEIRAESGGAQHGMSFDDRGRKFVCSNSDHIQLVMYEDRYAARNPYFAMPPARASIAADGPAAEVFRISPDEPWRVIRTKWRMAGIVPGPIEGGGRPSGYFTGATGTTIYRGDVFPQDFAGDAFIADCGSNLVHRKKLRSDGVGLKAERPVDEQMVEFLASTDNWFRPVQFANAPDGALYIADMYREVIEHPWSLPESIKKHLDLNSGNDRGRIYRVVPEGFKQRTQPRLSKASTKELIALLEHPNGWHRDTAARLLYERQDKAAVGGLQVLVWESKSSSGRLHALYALAGLGTVSSTTIQILAASDADEGVREHAVRLFESIAEFRRFPGPTDLRGMYVFGALRSLVTNAPPRVRYQLAFTLGEGRRPERTEVLARLVLHERESAWVIRAALSSVGSDAVQLFDRILSEAPEKLTILQWEFLEGVAGILGAEKSISSVLDQLARIDPPARSVALAVALGRGLERSGSKLGDFNEGGRLAPVFGRALQLATNDATGSGLQLSAIELLGMTDFKQAGSVLMASLNPERRDDVQMKTVAALAKFSEPEATEALLSRWSVFTPRVRTEVIEVLLRRTDRTTALLSAIERGLVQQRELSATQVDSLRKHRDTKIRERAMKTIGEALATKRDEVVNSFLPALQLRGNPANGKKIFTDRCASCHRLGGQGQALGPDLNTVKTAGKEKLLVNILDPNREAAPNFLNFTVETKSGETFAGLIASETAGSLTLQGPNGVETVVLRSQIGRLQSSGESVMPEGLEAGLAPQDMADLLEYLGVAD